MNNQNLDDKLKTFETELLEKIDLRFTELIGTLKTEFTEINRAINNINIEHGYVYEMSLSTLISSILFNYGVSIDTSAIFRGQKYQIIESNQKLFEYLQNSFYNPALYNFLSTFDPYDQRKLTNNPTIIEFDLLHTNPKEIFIIETTKSCFLPREPSALIELAMNCEGYQKLFTKESIIHRNVGIKHLCIKLIQLERQCCFFWAKKGKQFMLVFAAHPGRICPGKKSKVS